MRTERLLAKRRELRFPEAENPHAPLETAPKMWKPFLPRPSRPDPQRKLSPPGVPGSIDRDIPSTAQMIWRQAAVTTTCCIVHLPQTDWNSKSEFAESLSKFAAHRGVHQHRARRAMLLRGLAQSPRDPGGQFRKAQLRATYVAFPRRERGALQAERHPDTRTDSHSESREKTEKEPESPPRCSEYCRRRFDPGHISGLRRPWLP